MEGPHRRPRSFYPNWTALVTGFRFILEAPFIDTLAFDFVMMTSLFDHEKRVFGAEASWAFVDPLLRKGGVMHRNNKTVILLYHTTNSGEEEIVWVLSRQAGIWKCIVERRGNAYSAPN